MFEVGDVFLGENGNTFTITEHKEGCKSAGLVDDYTLFDKKGVKVHATDSLLNWLLKSGGLIRKERKTT